MYNICTNNHVTETSITDKNTKGFVW